MKYILNDNIALRSWRLVPFAYYIKGIRRAQKLSAEDFLLLLSCDGKTEQDPEQKDIKRLDGMGLIRPAKEGESLNDWQKARFCDNRYMPGVNWSITGKCNYNCKHCFMAKDNEKLMKEFSWEEMLAALDEFDKCGIQTIELTGGEPMLHPHFMDLVREIHRRGMDIDVILTNGAFITREILREIKSLGFNPLFKISFDGISHHDWMRGVEGAEQKTLEAVDLCVAEGVRVGVQICIHKHNLDTLFDTVKMIAERGVKWIRVIRTSEAPRWEENAPDACLDIDEYYEVGLDLLTKFAKTGLEADLIVWQFADFYSDSQAYRLAPVDHSSDPERDLRRPTCVGARGSMAISSEGQVSPCNQMSGYFAKHGIDLGNIKNGVQPLLQDGDYLKSIVLPVSKVLENPICSVCKYSKYCLGGCRAIAGLLGEYMGPDLSKCVFFKKGYYQRARRAFDEAGKECGRKFICVTPIEEFEKEMKEMNEKNEISEKDLEQAAGGFRNGDGTTGHESTYLCDKYEQKSGAYIPVRCCGSCVHGREKFGGKVTYTCELGVE